MKQKDSMSAILILCLFLALLPQAEVLAATYTVLNTNDSGAGSLRQAIIDANTNPGPDTIEFSIPGDDPGCSPVTKVCTIRPTSALPALSGGETTIDGYSQGDASPATADDPAAILIALDGSLTGSSGLSISSADNVIRGLAIYDFNYGVMIGGESTTGNGIVGNYIGVSAAGDVAPGNTLDGVMIFNGAHNNLVGGDEPGDRNVISGNSHGVQIWDVGADLNTVSGNYIGTDANGTAALGNTWGIVIAGGAQRNTIGGNTAGKRNVISANDEYGAEISGSETVSNTIIGNYVGTDASGAVALGNGDQGVIIGGGAQHNTIGGDTAGERNVISGNSENGVALGEENTAYNVVSGNYIGADATGEADLGNGYSGVFIGLGAQDNLIGGDEAGERNVISGNEWEGVGIHGSDTTNNTVSGNYVGTNATGTASVPNTLYGVRIYGSAQHNTVGGDEAGERNVISGNAEDGVRIVDSGTDHNTISGNYIGTAANGTSVLANGEDGVRIRNGAQYNRIGGDTAGERNVVTGNTSDGVTIEGSGTMSNTVSGNYIGVDATGTAAPGNSTGVYITDGAQYNLIGGDTAGERNVISGNIEWYGVRIAYGDTMSNTVAGNFIGTDADGTSALQNHFGVSVSMAHHNTIGPDNVISGNERHGVHIAAIDTLSNTVAGNYIGTDASGQVALANAESGVYLSGSAQHNTIGGETEEDRNVISGNGQHGVYIRNDDTDYNTVSGNYIGVAADGTTALGNADYGVLIENGPESNPVAENVISANEYGVVIQSAVDEDVATHSNSVAANAIGVAADGVSALGNTHDGVRIGFRGQSNTVVANLIAHNGDDGVQVDTPTAFDNVIWLNSIHDNDAMGINLTNGANHSIGAPIIYDVVPGAMTVSGAACPDCWVEVFASPDDDGEGQVFLGLADAGAAGDFDVTVGSLPYPYLTATATNLDDADGTSEFSEVFTATIPVLSTSTKTVTATHPMPGQPLTYTITLTNTGTAAASATMTDTLPAEVTWADNYSVSTGTLTWHDGENRLLWSGTVNVGTPETVVYRVTMNDDVTDGTVITNTATVDDGLVNVQELSPATITVNVTRIYLPLVLRQHP